MYEGFDLGAGVFTVDESGPANAAGAESVGAATWYQAEPWNSPLVRNAYPPVLIRSHRQGDTPIILGARGRRLSTPIVRLKLRVTGSDGDVARVAALMFDQRATWHPVIASSGPNRA